MADEEKTEEVQDVPRKACGCPETAPNRGLTSITQGAMLFCAVCNTRLS